MGSTVKPKSSGVGDYWLDLAIVAVAVLAFAIGLFHHAGQPDLSRGNAGATALSRHTSTQALQGTTLFSLDTVTSLAGTKILAGMGTSTVKVRRGDGVRLTGWAIDRAAGGPASSVLVRLDDRRTFVADYGSVRPDVARAFGVPGYLNSGFSVQLPSLSVGRHRISLLIYSLMTGGYYFESNRVVLDVR